MLPSSYEITLFNFLFIGTVYYSIFLYVVGKQVFKATGAIFFIFFKNSQKYFFTAADWFGFVSFLFKQIEGTEKP